MKPAFKVPSSATEEYHISQLIMILNNFRLINIMLLLNAG